MFHDANAVQVTLTGQEWLLTAIDGQPADEALGQSATFGDDGTVTGSGGCNDYFGPYTVDGESLAIGPLAATRASCGDDVDASEARYLRALEAAASFVISGTDLAISTEDGTTLEFAAQAGPGPQPTATPAVTPEASAPAVTPQASAPAVTPRASTAPSPGASGAVGGSIVGSWKLTSYIDSDLPAGLLNIDVTFAADGTFSGFGGCNDYSGSWSLDGTSLAMSGFESASSGSCDDTTQSLEQGYFSLVPFLDTAEVAADGTLKLTASLADTSFEFEPAG